MSEFNCVNDFVTTLVIPAVVVNCFAVGVLIKTSVPCISNEKIPLVVALIGILYNIWLNNWSITPQIFVEGLVSGLASTGSFELLKNLGLNI